MKFSAILTLVIAAFILPGTVHANGEALSPLAEKAVSGTDIESAEAVKSLRNSGPDGLKALFDTYAAEIDEFRVKGIETERWQKIAAAIDAVAMQKDAYASGLYWYTDFDEAKKAASKTDKPILTLRLLGNLNEEFSCANSRLFRSLLYANREISKYLSDNYILHWKSVRPAPRITIDFGDGRKIERTITGNSIHYILDDDGEIIDALPGLYSPKAFLIYLTQAKQVNDAIDGKERRIQDLALLRYRKLCFDRLRDKRERVGTLAKVQPRNAEGDIVTNFGDAFAAAPRAVTKVAVTDEISLLRVYDTFTRLAPFFYFGDWEKLAAFYSPMPVLDDASTSFVRRQTGLTDAEFNKMITRLRSFVGLDTTRNDFIYHMQLYTWLNAGRTSDIEQFNSRVYSEIFLTPDSDKWLGLYSTDVYTALDGNGITK
ncbi:MAG: hypothetical protein AB7F88_05965 [Pyrinomonadaceae bacterium]